MNTTFTCKKNGVTGLTHKTCLIRQQAKISGFYCKTPKYSSCQNCKQGARIKALYPDWKHIKKHPHQYRVPLEPIKTFLGKKRKQKQMPKNTSPWLYGYDTKKAQKLSQSEERILTRLESIGEAKLIAEGL